MVGEILSLEVMCNGPIEEAGEAMWNGLEH